MTRPGKPGRSRPLFSSTYGGSIDVPEGEEPLDCCDPGPRPDRAEGTAAFTISSPASGGIIQTTIGEWSPSGAGFNESFASTPTVGSLLVGVLFCGEGDGVIDTAGWSEIEDGSSNFPIDHVGIWTKTAGVAESTDVHVETNGAGKVRKLVLFEVAGSFDDSGATDDDSNASPLTGATLTSSGAGVLIAAFMARVATYAATPTFTPQGGLQTDSFERHGTSGRTIAWVGHQTTEAGSYTPTVATTPLAGGAFHGESGSVAIIVDATTVAADWIIPAPLTVDGDDATYHEIEGPDVLRVDLGAAFRIARAALRIGTENAGARTYTIRGANAADFSDAVELSNADFTATGSFTAQDVEFLWSTDESYQYFELTGTSETRRIFSFELYEPSVFAGEDHNHDAIEAEIDALADALDAIGEGFETYDGGGNPLVHDHGSMGATETIDAALGNRHRGTLDANCTITVAPFADGSIDFAVTQDGTGGWAITWSGVTFADDDQPDLTIGAVTWFVLVSDDGVVYGFKAGGGGAALTVEDEGTPLATAATTLDFVGAGVTASGIGAEKTITIPGVTEAAVQAVGHYELLMTGSSPPEPLEDGTGTDWLYVWVYP